jgi:TolB-like protein
VHTSGTKRLLVLILGVIAVTLILLFSPILLIFRDRNIVPTIAVLPIQSLSHDSVQDYFSDGVTDALIAELARLPGVRVLSRTSVLRFKNTKLSIKDVASQLHVRYVVEGTLFRQDKRVRLTTQLIEAHSERQLWAETYDRDERDLLTLESEVSAGIAPKIQLRLSPKEEKRLRAPRPLDLLAQDTFLRARYFMTQRSPESLNRAIAYFKATIEREPAYAPAYAGLADASGERMAALSGRAFAGKSGSWTAFRLDPELAEGHSALGSIADTFDWDWKTARREFETAIGFNANDSTTSPLVRGNACLIGRL